MQNLALSGLVVLQFEQITFSFSRRHFGAFVHPFTCVVFAATNRTSWVVFYCVPAGFGMISLLKFSLTPCLQRARSQGSAGCPAFPIGTALACYIG
jgi:hypothetical protein